MALVGDDTRTMKTTERFRFVAIVGVVLAMLTAGIGLADGFEFDTDEPDPALCEPTDDGGVDDGVVDDGVVDDGDVVDGVDDGTDVGDEPTEGEDGEDGAVGEDGEEPTEDGDDPVDDEDGVDDGTGEGEEPTDDDQGEDCEEPEDGVEEEDPAEEEDAAEADADAATYTPEDCLAAAGLEAADEPDEKPVPGELRGLENATAHLLWNCLDHPNHGLVNALTKHALRLEGWLERQELKDARKAEREAAKAEREAARAAAKAEREAAKAARELSRSG